MEDLDFEIHNSSPAPMPHYPMLHSLYSVRLLLFSLPNFHKLLMTTNSFCG
jgi:hypothetical protein